MKVIFKVRYPFSNGDYYIERLEGKRAIAWVKVGEVPERLRRLAIPGRHDLESISFKERQTARLVAMELGLEANLPGRR